MEFKRCPNCGGPLQAFRPLSDEEKSFVRKEKPDFPPEAYVRCTAEGCLRYQRSLNWKDGGNLPPPDDA
ncbi:hypothetical protein ABT124_23950 [Streptomyces sp. NPDC001982]|uniref:hypothetical protein n=1 Tax=unclassified Streptomyces TaxID=2593676 RepID=UPI003323EFAF